MEPLGPKIAEGRDSEIYEHGPGRVLRVARDGRSLRTEGEVHSYVRAHGYPAPAVFESGDGWLVMERVEGPTMLAASLQHPQRVPAYGRMLADLHQRLHALAAPPTLPEVALPGDRLLHRDLHPLNVLMSPAGPVVIDWANAARGDPAWDLADTWILFSTADVPGGWPQKLAASVFRRIFIRAFLGGVDREAARRGVAAVVEHRLRDRHMTEGEKARMQRMADRVG